VAHKAVLAVLVQVLDLPQLLDRHCRVEQVDKVLDHSLTGLVAVVAALVIMAAAVAAVVMTMDREPEQHLVAVEGLDT
jgi:hypothetical protein